MHNIFFKREINYEQLLKADFHETKCFAQSEFFVVKESQKLKTPKGKKSSNRICILKDRKNRFVL